MNFFIISSHFDKIDFGTCDHNISPKRTFYDTMRMI